MEDHHMQDFWDARAREDAYFFVDNRRRYRAWELVSFWQDGERDLDRLLGLLDVRIGSGDVVLDVGCGVGRLTRVIAARAARAYGIDVSREMIELARIHHGAVDNIEWIAGDGKSLRPLGDGSVDGCVSHVVFQHIPDPEITLGYVTEMGRVLRVGGWAAFQISNDARVHRSPPTTAVRRRLQVAIGRAPRGQADPAWLGSAVELEPLRAAARAGGLQLDRVVGEGTQFCLVRARKA